MSGRYCEKHEEWAPTGECRWCEPAQSVGGGPLPGLLAALPLTMPEQMWRAKMGSSQQAVSAANLQQKMNDLWVKLRRKEEQS